jgi:hypothetical protein
VVFKHKLLPLFVLAGVYLVTLTIVFAAPVGYLIYDETLASGWVEAGWSWDSTVDLNNTSTPHSGTKSATITFNAAWAGFSLRTASPVNTSGYSAISFWAHGGSSGTRHLTFYTQSADSSGGSTPIDFSVAAGSWTQVTMSLSALGNPALIARLNIQDASGAAQPTFYVDELRLVASSTPSADIVIQPSGVYTSFDPSLMLGSNLAMWVRSDMVDAPFITRTRALGSGLLRIPGGAASQEYGWLSCQMGVDVVGAYPCHLPYDPYAFDDARPSDFMAFLRATGKEALYSVNLTATAKEAAAAVAFFNAAITDTTPITVDVRGTDWYTAGHWALLRASFGFTEPIGIKYWDVGNETYGGTPASGGASCAPWGWENVWTCSGAEYINGATRGSRTYEGYREFRAQMKRIDPTILVGAIGFEHVTSGYTYNQYMQDLLQAAQASGVDIDFLTVHPYTYDSAPADDAQILSQPQAQYPAIKAELQTAMATYYGRQIPIWVTEYNLASSDDPKAGQAVNSLFVADVIGQIIQNGYSAALQWDLADGTNLALMNTPKYGGATYPRAPEYFALPLWSRFGNQMLPVTASFPAASQLSVYAGRASSATVSLLAINKTGASITTTIAIAGNSITGGVIDVARANALSDTTMTFNGVSEASLNSDLSNAPSSALTNAGDTISYTFAPYSITVIRLNITNPVKLDQAITFDPLPNKTLGDPTFPVTATASSGLPVSYTSLTLSVCTLSGNMTTLVSAGACTIRAMQSGDATYNPAPSVDQSFQVTPPLMVYLPLMMK